jgi:hypothetical protein
MPYVLFCSGPCGGRIIPDGMNIASSAFLALSGWGYADFHAGVNFRFYGVLRSPHSPDPTPETLRGRGEVLVA